MGGKGKQRWWRLSDRRWLSYKYDQEDTPREFLCPVLGRLMFDPVVVSSGHTFDRTSVQVCKDLGFRPQLPDDRTPDFSAVIPNIALRAAILNWCDKSGATKPLPPDYYAVESTVRALMTDSGRAAEDPGFRVSEKELLRAVSDHPPAPLSRASSELNQRYNHNLYYSMSSEESVIANSPPLPACLSSPTSLSNSSEIISDEAPSSASNSSSSLSGDEYYVAQFEKLDSFDQEQAVIELRKATRTNEEARVSLCTSRLLSALKPLVVSRYAGIQPNATAALVNLSLAKVNKLKIVRAGFLPLLIDVLKGGFEESQEHAAGVIFSLSLEDDNKTAIGVLGALQPLLHALRTGTERTRCDSALALYHLTLVQSNRSKLIKMGAAAALVGMLNGGELASIVVLVVCNLAACAEGKAALLDAQAVETVVGLLRHGSELDEATQENCLAALYSLSQGCLRFKGMARNAMVAEVLQGVSERGSERAKEKAKRLLEVLGAGNEDEMVSSEEEEEEELEVGLSRPRHRAGKGHLGAE
ncbi:hypothetical protein DM860_017747 [Cuscuta australis]|uniref:RING-type E3 ubiquitin transferase n=1 Tax=Cuscuta australis TaxID=267555 RepID=A0A328D9T2_9ASTE|nr:hypothetical protein DM860_017747 [Cuscuta australis]